VEASFIEQLKDTFADLEFSGLFLPHVAFVCGGWGAGYSAERSEGRENVRIVCGELIFVLRNAFLLGNYVSCYLRESLGGIGRVRSIIVWHYGLCVYI
jgi:hypothetical protein